MKLTTFQPFIETPPVDGHRTFRQVGAPISTVTFGRIPMSLTYWVNHLSVFGLRETIQRHTTKPISTL